MHHTIIWRVFRQAYAREELEPLNSKYPFPARYIISFIDRKTHTQASTIELKNAFPIQRDDQGTKKACRYSKPFYFFKWRPQGDSNPCRRRERPVSWTGLDDGDVWWAVLGSNQRLSA